MSISAYDAAARNKRRRDLVLDGLASGLFLVGTAVLLCMHYDWWPLASNLTYIPKLAISVVALAVLIAGLCVWVVRIYYAFRTRSLSPGAGLVPLIALAAIAVVVVSPAPSFENQRPAFTKAAVEILQGDSEPRANFSIAGVDVKAAFVRNGEVYFVDADNSVGSVVGWVYSPGKEPVSFKFLQLKPDSDGWYEFEYST